MAKRVFRRRKHNRSSIDKVTIPAAGPEGDLVALVHRNHLLTARPVNCSEYEALWEEDLDGTWDSVNRAYHNAPPPCPLRTSGFEPVMTTARARLLLAIASRPGQYLTPFDFMRFWPGLDSLATPSTLEATVSRTRREFFNETGKQPWWILTQRPMALALNSECEFCLILRCPTRPLRLDGPHALLVRELWAAQGFDTEETLQRISDEKHQGV